MTAESIYLALGSNIGDRLQNLRSAIDNLNQKAIRVRRTSSIYETEPVDYLDQPWFLNGVVEAGTRLQPLQLLQRLRSVEHEMGSEKLVPKGPRLLDLDILLYRQQTIDIPQLQIPHPRMHLRRFVLVPLVEIAPDLHHPNWAGTATQLLAACPDTSQVRAFGKF
jgi:2-amino-4-hydroxy-6-hydroxymethyldihydropteridine diphosphokinase